MTRTGRATAGEGELTYPRVLAEALGMLRQHFLRVALVALILFVPPILLTSMLHGVRASIEADPRLVPGLGYLLGLLLVTSVKLLGPVVYAGYLDEAVGHEYYRGRRIRFHTVLRTLPWGRLLLADLVLVLGTGFGLALFVLPGIAFLTLFTLIGPVLVQERRSLLESYRRTFALSRTAWPMILLLVVVLLVVEHAAHELVHQAVHHSAYLAQVVASWLASAVVGGFVGLVEVALATQLMARDPLPQSASGRPERNADGTIRPRRAPLR